MAQVYSLIKYAVGAVAIGEISANLHCRVYRGRKKAGEGNGGRFIADGQAQRECLAVRDSRNNQGRSKEKEFQNVLYHSYSFWHTVIKYTRPLKYKNLPI